MEELDEFVLANQILNDIEVVEELANIVPRRLNLVRNHEAFEELSDNQFIKMFR